MRFLRGGRDGEERDRSERGWAGLADRCWGGVLEDGGSEGSTVGRLPVRTGGTVAGPDGWVGMHGALSWMAWMEIYRS